MHWLIQKVTLEHGQINLERVWDEPINQENRYTINSGVNKGMMDENGPKGSPQVRYLQLDYKKDRNATNAAAICEEQYRFGIEEIEENG